MANSIDVRALIIAEANRQGVDPGIALAIATRETNTMQWYPNGSVVIGADGERGMFQLEPATAAALRVNPDDIYDNIKGGVMYLKQNYDRFGNWPDAIAAYNCGPGCVADYRAGKRTLPASTQQYVAFVAAVGMTNTAGINAGIQQNVDGADPSAAAADSTSADSSSSQPVSTTTIVMASAAGLFAFAWFMGE